MNERRRHRRLPIHLELEINQLFKQDHIIIGNLDEEIEVVNISKTGIGFMSPAAFPLEYYFNAKIEFDQKKFFYCVLKIIRKEAIDDSFLYGCEFVGLAEFLSNKVDEYEALLGDEE
ncbi:MAG: PilZ domain-containing protein [Vallitaleaceae bacterium]|nr:PilZ domain-containing protein [Vallitaleaceae bacterium]